MPGVFGGASLPIIACIALLAAAAFQILGFATTHWSNNGIYEVGLWRYGKCHRPVHYDCLKYDHVEYFQSDWLRAVRGMESLGIIFLSLPLVILPVYMYIALGMYYRCMMLSMCISSFLAAISIIVGVVVYAVEITQRDWIMGWSVIVCIVACALSMIGFLVLLVATISKRPEGIKKEYQDYLPPTIYIHPNKPKIYTVQNYDED